jgi:lambda repressor-like predicted transcriptional regulator
MFRGVERQLRLKPEIIRLYQRGRSSLWIGHKLGIAASTIGKWIKSGGIMMRSPGESNTLSRVGNKKSKYKSEIILLYQKSRKSPPWIGNNFGLCPATILAWLREEGIPIRSRSDSCSLSKVGNKKSKYKSEIISAYQKGKTLAWVGKQFKLSNVTVKNWLKEWGIQIRSFSEAAKLRRAA